MSSYPPPPPGQSYPPGFDRGGFERSSVRVQRQMLRDQARARKAQQRALRYQMQAHRRSLQRRSIVGPLILLCIGTVFLLIQFGTFSWSRFIDWYVRFWPLILIAAGVVLLGEWANDHLRSSSAGQHRVLGGGTVALLIFFAFLGLASRPVQYGLSWSDHHFGSGYTGWDHIFGDRHEADSSIARTLLPASGLLIRDPHGDVTVSGSSSDGQVHVSIHTQTYAWKSSEAERKLRSLQPAFSMSNGVLTLDAGSVEGAEADLTIQMPRSAPLTIQANRGDVTVNEMSAPVSVTASNGDLDLSAINGSVTVHVNDDNASLRLHSIHGPVSVQGHSGDIDISEISGDLMLQGDFFGSTNLQHIDGAVHFSTSRTQFSAARLDDQFSVDKDSLDATAVLGPVVLRTEDKNVTLDRVQGSIDLSNSNGPVEVTAAAPLDAISIQNHHGSVDLGLPGNSGFDVNAKAQNGDMENDFGLKPTDAGDLHSLSGLVSGGGATITISATDGDVTLRRSTVDPLPKLRPNSPIFTATPATPSTSAGSRRGGQHRIAPPEAPAPPNPPDQP
jgi:DUF4097 and DUF4098 domain-containing protein YvlB